MFSKSKMWLDRTGSAAALRLFERVLRRYDKTVVDTVDLVDFRLHQYESYAEYKAAQIEANQRKLHRIWADPETLSLAARQLPDRPDGQTPKVLCHGTRNGYEQRFFREEFGFDAIGTEIADTAKDFPHTVQHDFHESRADWVGTFDLIFSNSLDQAWNPAGALRTWIEQLAPGGRLVLEHGIGHVPASTSRSDPFGVRPIAMPYVLCSWFGHAIALDVVKTRKPEIKDVAVTDPSDLDTWLFVIARGPGALPPADFRPTSI